MSRRRGVVPLVGACILTLTLGACSAGGTSASGDDSLTLALNFAPAPAAEWTGMLVAEQSGLYEEAGLEVEVSNLSGSADVVKSVGSGQVDVGFASADSFLVGVSQGLPLVAVANVVPKNYAGVIAPVRSGIETLEDVDGKKISSALASPEPLLLQALDGDSEPEIVYVEPQSKCTVVQGGDADACTGLANYQVPLMQRAGDDVTFISFDSEQTPIIGPVLFTRPEVIEDKPELIRSFLEATAEGYTAAYADVDAAVKMFGQQYPDIDISDGFLNEAIELTKPYLTRDDPSLEPGWGQMSPELWTSLIQILNDGGMINNSPAAADVFDNDLLPKGDWSLDS
ncbi:UNVERIFIED_ORG: ABC-type nitrate/sulfonate/bicarbonate transport system substrate-binding protein [Gordonia westfalica J30]